MSLPVWVRRQGNVCTVFLDEAEQPMPIASFEAPPMGFPFTASAAEIAGRYPGRPLYFVDPPNQAPPPNAKPLDPLHQAMFDRAVTEALGPSSSPAAAPPVTPAAPRAEPVAPDGAWESIDDRVLLNAFAALAKENPAHAEVVGTFLINCDPDWEPRLREAVARPAPRRAFKL